MALSSFEKRLVQSIIKDLNVNKYKRLKFFLLSFEGLKALIKEDSSIIFRINYLNNDTIYHLIEDINNNPTNYSQININGIYVSALSGRSNGFISTILKDFPDIATKCILKSAYYWNVYKFIRHATNDEIITILNSYRNNKNDFSGIYQTVDSQVALLISLLNDQDKPQYVDLMPYDYSDYTYLEQLFSSTKDYEALKNVIYSYICDRGYLISDKEELTKFISNEELLELSLKYISENKKNILEYFNTFSIQDRLRLLDATLFNGDSYQSSFIRRLISDSLETEKNLYIYKKINDLYTKHNIDFNYLYGFEEKIISIVNTMNPSELLNIIKEIKISSLRELIVENDNLWTNKEIFSYLLETDINFIFSKLTNLNSFSKYSDEVKNLFCSREAVLALAKHGVPALLNLNPTNDEYYGKIFSYFSDDSFCRELIKQNPQSVVLVLKHNPKHEFLFYAQEQGFRPDSFINNFIKEHPEFRDDFLKILRDLDPYRPDFIDSFCELTSSEDEEIMDIFFHKAALNINITYNDFVNKFNTLKKVNCEVIRTFDYRLFSDKFNFLTMDKIEFLGAHHNVARKLCNLNDSEIEAIKRVIVYSSNINWIDLLDRILSNIDSYSNLIDDLKDRDLSVDDIGLLTKTLVQKNILNIQSYQDLQNYNQLIDNRIDLFSTSDDITQVKEAISLSILGLDYNEFVRISEIYCSDLDNLNKYSKNEVLIDALTFIRKVATCQDIDVLKEIFKNTPRMNLSTEFIVNFDSEIRREFARLYNATLYHVDEKDKTNTLYFKEVKTDDGKIVFVQVPEGEGEAVSFYSPIGLDPNNQVEFAIMMTSLGAYSDHREPEDYYSNWNVDMISSHGFCCSYLTNDNLGTARICHAVLGFTDFSLDGLLLSAPYDIGSNGANQAFNTSREVNTRYCTPRGMVDSTRHTHNEVVWERRNLGATGSFKKEPSYVIFFCEDMANLSQDEEKVYQSTVKAAVQLGHGKPLPVVVIERIKIAKYQQEEIINELRQLKDTYEPGLIKKIITRSISNIVGNTYTSSVNDLYFNDTFQDFVTNQIQNYIISLVKNGNYDVAIKAINELSETMNKEMENAGSYDISPLAVKLNYLSINLEGVLKILEENKNIPSKTLFNLMSLVMNMNDDNYTKRWSEYRSNHDVGSVYDYSKISSSVINAVYNNTLIQKIIELEQDKLYRDDTPYNNRYFANMFLYATLFYNTSQSYLKNIKLDEVLDAIKFAQCSYMDGRDNKNVSSALAKADKIMDSKGYDEFKKERIKVLIALRDERNLTPERINTILTNYNITKNPFEFESIEQLRFIINIMHDAMCMEHSRFITGGEVEESYFYEPSFYNYVKIAYQLQEGYAMMDIGDFINEHPEIATDVMLAQKTQNPQTIIRNLRKRRFEAPKQSNNTFEEAFLCADVSEKTDPLNLVSVKMKEYGELPPQISLGEFYKLVSDMPLYSYLKEQIATSQDLYLTTSPIHGATHANNVTLFASFIASTIGLTERDIKTIIEASIYHDIGRVNDNNSREHGRLGAMKYGIKVQNSSGVSKEEVQFLIEAHAVRTYEDVEKLVRSYNFDEKDYDRLIKMAAVIRDADALDRTRFRLDQKNNNLNPNYLFFDVSKRMIEACQRLNYIIYENYVKEKVASNTFTFS